MTQHDHRPEMCLAGRLLNLHPQAPLLAAVASLFIAHTNKGNRCDLARE
jgi:hypothetical protein